MHGDLDSFQPSASALPMPSSNGPIQTCNWQPAELLQYLPAYKVVICVACRYAIQPNGIARHLRNLHQIRRGDRRSFMQYVASLRLDAPDSLREVVALDFPVPLLPVQDGLRCKREACAHLCISVKRMKNHWLSVHGCTGQADIDWCPVPLQTFFRGNFLRYFTGASSSATSVDDSVRYGILSNAGDHHNGEVHLNKSDVNTEIIGCNIRPITTPFPALSGLQLQSQLDEAGAALLHQYITSTSLTLATDDRTKTLWSITIPRIASQFPFLLHGILACAALHLAHLNPEQQRGLIMRGAIHQDLAMPTFRSTIAKPDRDNCHAVFAFSHLLVIYSFAAEREDERLLLVESNNLDVLPSWLYFIRSGCSMLCDVWEQLESGPVASLVSAWEIPITFSVDEHTPLVDSLLSAIPPQSSKEPWPQDVCDIYRDAALDLGLAFSCTRDLSDGFTAWDAVRLWPMRISVEYLDLLRQQHPGALILVAHYCILLQRLDCHWYFEGRARRLMSTVLACLDERWHSLIAWPLAEIEKKFSSIPKASPPREACFYHKIGSTVLLSEATICGTPENTSSRAEA